MTVVLSEHIVNVIDDDSESQIDVWEWAWMRSVQLASYMLEMLLVEQARRWEIALFAHVGDVV